MSDLEQQATVFTCRHDTKKGGFTLVELMIAVGVLLVAVLTLAAFVVPLSRQREQSEALRTVLSAARSRLEEIKGVDPALVEATYDGRTFDVPGIDGAKGGGSTLEVTVDATSPDLLVVTVTATWNVLGHVEAFELTTDLYNPGGEPE